MAVMIPKEIDPNTDSHAERLLFRLFSTELPQEFTVLHSIRFVFLDSKRRVQDGEIDFLIVHPDLGLLVLEVKGGKIYFSGSLNGGHEEWFSESRNGKQHRLKRSPIRQAHDAMYNLMAKINHAPTTATFKYGYARAVAFPDVVTSSTTWGIDVLPQQVLGSQHLGDIESAIRSAYGTSHSADRVTRKLRDALVGLLKPSGAVEQLGLMNEIKSNELQIKLLSEQQYGLISFLQGQHRAVINGCAGSGKTMLALEKARSLAAQGFDVLLTCYNKGLSSWLRKNVETFDQAISDRILVAHFHDLAVTLCNESGYPIDVSGRMGEKNFWDEIVPTQLFETIPHIERRFDAIVADEGQDFDADWWITLQQLLHDPEHGVFYIFRDQQQDLYGRDPDLPFRENQYALTSNHRNSRQIHALTTNYFDGDPKPESVGPAGREPEIIPVTSSTMLSALGGVLQRLTVDEGIDASSIVVLTPRGTSGSMLKEGYKVANRSLTWKEAPPEGSIRVATIYGFKGLESDVVLLVEADSLHERSKWKELSYVALTRARHHLIVLGELPAATTSANRYAIHRED